MTRDQLLAYIQRELNTLVEGKFNSDDLHLASIYQAGFLSSVLATAIYNDSHVADLFRNAIKQAHSRQRGKEL